MRWKNRRLLRMVRLAVQAAVAASPLLLHAAGVVVVDEVDGLRSNCRATPKCGVAFPVNSSFVPLAEGATIVGVGHPHSALCGDPHKCVSHRYSAKRKLSRGGSPYFS